MARFDDLLSALGAGAAIPGVMGVGPGRTWDAVVAAHAPALTGQSVTFVALADGTLVVSQDVPDGSLGPVADEIETMVAPPYRAAAARTEGETWAAVAESVEIVELPGVSFDEVELTVVSGERTVAVEGEPIDLAVPALDALAEGQGDVAIHAERVDGDTYAVDVFPL